MIRATSSLFGCTSVFLDARWCKTGWREPIASPATPPLSIPQRATIRSRQFGTPIGPTNRWRMIALTKIASEPNSDAHPNADFESATPMLRNVGY